MIKISAISGPAPNYFFDRAPGGPVGLDGSARRRHPSSSARPRSIAPPPPPPPRRWRGDRGQPPQMMAGGLGGPPPPTVSQSVAMAAAAAGIPPHLAAGFPNAGSLAGLSQVGIRQSECGVGSIVAFVTDQNASVERFSANKDAKFQVRAMRATEELLPMGALYSSRLTRQDSSSTCWPC